MRFLQWRNKTSDGFTADKCLENGLCENDWKSTDENGTTVMNIGYFRDSCTTTDWKNGGCLNICTEQTNPKNGSSTGFVQVTPCDGTANSTTWCCGKDNSCCDTPAAVTIAQTLAAQTSTVASISTASATSNPTTTHSHTSTQTTTSSSTPSSSASSGLSDGAKAGIGVGVGVGVIAIFAVAFFFVRRRHGNRANGTIGGNSRPAHDYSYVEAPQDFNQGVPVQSVPVYEKGAGPDAERFELPSDPAHGNGN
ncbi:hypothetical protein BGW36DRAFT_364297 [Talaromyces proteolyticus]|uniref:Mid2 domain-containing protein n=1 Tax=Talaromyces proteolyticus TaxID=1131652 RepID=A0AAD4KFW2_9EURO|nr:uncharacterized protein BGW36DRAFT_364297 [Talaromyces proteolyticus]KAH8690731.1 hypothetical protein BGW36DRAFT_364297 [Talaromyces proteolyticus]